MKAALVLQRDTKTLRSQGRISLCPTETKQRATTQSNGSATSGKDNVLDDIWIYKLYHISIYVM